MDYDGDRILDVAAGHLDLMGWQYIRVPEQQVLRLEVDGQHGRWVCYVRARESEHQLVIYSNAPVTVPPGRRQAMADFLTRANFGLILGNFEMDFDDGELHYKTSIDVTGDQLSPALVDPLFRANVLTMDQYLPGILAVIAGESATSAIARVEDET